MANESFSKSQNYLLVLRSDYLKCHEIILTNALQGLLGNVELFFNNVKCIDFKIVTNVPLD